MDNSISNSQLVSRIGKADQFARSSSSPFGLEQQETLAIRKRFCGMISVASKVRLKDRSVLSLIYTPGVAAPCLAIEKEPLTAYDYTLRGNTIALVSDGPPALGFGNIGPMTALPMLEDACILFKTFGGVNAYPICLSTQDVDEIVAAVQRIALAFGGINLEDISAPRCFEVEELLRDLLDIPIVHDDQHGTAIVILAGIMNALRLVNRAKQDVTAVLVGAGVAGIDQHLPVDRIGILRPGLDGMTVMQEEQAARTNPNQRSGGLAEAITGASIFIFVSASGILSAALVQMMATQAIVFALAKPNPEILPEAALAVGARVVATGSSDYPNRVKNSLVFPGLFRGALDVRARLVNTEMKLAAAEHLASLVSEQDLHEGQIIPQAMNYEVAPALAAMDSRVASLRDSAQLVARSCNDFIYEGIMAPIPAMKRH